MRTSDFGALSSPARAWSSTSFEWKCKWTAIQSFPLLFLPVSFTLMSRSFILWPVFRCCSLLIRISAITYSQFCYYHLYNLFNGLMNALDYWVLLLMNSTLGKWFLRPTHMAHKINLKFTEETRLKGPLQ